MAYDVSTVTALGATLLASATAADKLILVGCDATTEVLTQAQAVAITSRPANPFSTTQRIGLEGADDNHVYVRALFVAGESTGGDANTLYLYGHSESDPNTTIVLAVLSAATAFHLPLSGDVANTYGVLFDIIYSVASGAIETINSSAYATYAEFLRLKNRTVTTYKDGDTTQGDNQTIRGEKSFLNDCEMVSLACPDVIVREDPTNTGCDVRMDGFSSSDYYGVTLGYCDSTQSLSNLDAWNACVQVRSKGKPDVSQGIISNCAIRLSTRDTGNTENCYLCVANEGGDPSIDSHVRYDVGGGDICDSRLMLNGSSITTTVSLEDYVGVVERLSKIYTDETQIKLESIYKDAGYDKGSGIIFNTGEVTDNGTTKKVGSVSLYASGYNGQCHISLASTSSPHSRIDLTSGESNIFIENSKVELNSDNEVRIIGSGEVNIYADDTLIRSDVSANITTGNPTNGTVYSRIYEEPESTIIATYGITGGLGDAQLEVQNVSNTPVIINKCGNVQTHTIKFQDNSMCYWGLESSSNPVRIIFEKSNNKGVFYPKNESPYASCDIGKSTNKFEAVYANDFYGGNVYGNPNEQDDLELTLTADRINVTGSVVPTTGNINIGKNSNKFNAVYAENLIGRIPTTTSIQNPEVGSIFLALILATQTTFPARGIGYDITPGAIEDHGYTMWVAQIKVTSGHVMSIENTSSLDYISVGTYRLLSNIPDASDAQYSAALVMRVS